MSAYWFGRANPRDHLLLAQYAEIVSRIQPQYGLEPLSRGQAFIELEGELKFERYFLHRFPSMDAARAMFDSPEYRMAAAIRQAACDGCELVIIDGGDNLKGSW
ncbi:DUF1330 domain-containing protein [Sinomonas sp. JGH33]|uniref:DUF1330 domain-containing protein n=1 Tax=Sinomonas terricola TaxID=3110330 RepID=A0ABU5T9C7_9MICC|nr:DUF1330 domain-containing protein [Sinomonas sp. JGH33]MEA5456304.1 DUF1330 domain-containing protein [Sinomonas sp. JGH33]